MAHASGLIAWRGIAPPPTPEWIDVWPVRLAAPETLIKTFLRVLSSEESARASRFHFDHLKRAYLLSRGALRVLIGQYLRTDPSRVRLELGPQGKPRIASKERLYFNLSHSGSLVLFAFAIDCELGIDVEQIRPVPDINQIATRFFCPGEAAELLSVPDDKRVHAFFLCWTRKEAYLKAIGDGLAAPLNRFRVAVRPGEICRILHVRNDPSAAEEWSLHNLEPSPGYAAALAYHGRRRRVRMFPLLEPAALLCPQHGANRRHERFMNDPMGEFGARCRCQCFGPANNGLPIDE